jgi:hypothetical protein
MIMIYIYIYMYILGATEKRPATLGPSYYLVGEIHDWLMGAYLYH